jgi:hypothetical protein
MEVWLHTSQRYGHSPVLYILMYLHMIQFLESISTHITVIWMLPSVLHTSEPSYASVAWKFYYEHHNDMHAPQNVHVDLPPYAPVAWMIFTHIRVKWTFPWMNIDVPSNYFWQWLFYYSHHKHIEAPQCVLTDTPTYASFITHITAMCLLPSM